MSNPLAEYRNEVWAMEPRALESFLGHVTDLFAAEPVAAGLFEPDPSFKSRMTTIGGVAEIPVAGVLLKRVPAIFRRLGLEATGYSEIVADIKAALEDKDVKVIRLKIESPGGQVAGVAEAGDAIYAARLEKNVTAQISDIGASAAYWLASQANTISADRNAQIGSIGVYTVAVDSSEAAKQEGYKVHVISSGEYKGAGVPGSPITEKQLEGMKAVIEGMANNFIAAVAGGREIPTKTAIGWATGQVWLAADAKAMGIIDSIEGEKDNQRKAGASDVPAAVVTILANESEETIMADTTKTDGTAAAPVATPPAPPAAAVPAPDPLAVEKTRQADILAAFPGEPQFALEQITAGATVDQAKIAFSDVLRARLEAANKENAELKAAKAPAVAGAPALATAVDVAAGVKPDFKALVEAYRKEHQCSETAAVLAVNRAHPTAREEYLEKRADELRATKASLGMSK